MTKYYCSECECYHSKGKNFKEHKEFAIEISSNEAWKRQFKKSWKNYNIESHTKTHGSKKQIERSKLSKIYK